MAASPWIKFFTSDFLTGIADLAADEIGVYTVILSLVWDRGAPIPDDPSWLARRSGTSTRRFNQIKARLISLGKLEVRGGMIGNHRALAEVAKRDGKSDQARQAALARWHREGEPELPLQDGEPQPPARTRAHGSAANGQIKSGKTGGKPKEQVDLKSGTPDGKPQKSANLTDADASSLRARARLQKPEARITSQPDSEDGSPVRAPARDEAPPDRLNDRDLKSLVDGVCEAAGYRPISTGQIDRVYRIVEEWRDAGFDFNAVVVPTIKAVVAESPEPTRTLGRFTARIRHEHARLRAKGEAGTPYRPPVSPILNVPGEDPVVRPIREELLQRIGPSLYCARANAARLEVVTDAGGGRRPLRVIDSGNVRLNDGDTGTVLAVIAKRHGFTELW